MIYKYNPVLCFYYHIITLRDLRIYLRNLIRILLLDDVSLLHKSTSCYLYYFLPKP